MKLKSSVDYYMKGGKRISVDTNLKYNIKLQNISNEPSDINWENQNISLSENFYRQSMSFLLISLFLTISMLFTIWSQGATLEFAEKSKSCEKVYEQ